MRRPLIGIAVVVGLWLIRWLQLRQRNDEHPLTINIEGHHETLDQYIERHERELRARTHVRNLKERRVCHQLAPIVGGIAAVYGFISEQSTISRVEMAAIYFAVGYLAIWATWLFDRLLRPTALTASQHSSLASYYFGVARRQSREGQESQR